MDEEKNEYLPDTIAEDQPDQPGVEIHPANEVDAETGEEKNNGEFNSGESIEVGEIVSRLDALIEQIGSLSTEFKTKIKYDQHKEKIIDDLHREVQEYKNDLIKNLLRPVIMDIIHTIDDITKLVNHYRLKDSSEVDPQKLIKQMEDISSDLEDILFRQGVESFNSDRPEFDPKQQKIIKTEVTGEQAKDRTISGRIHNGYQWEGKVLRQEIVNVYVYKPGSVNVNPEINKNDEEIKNHE